MARQQAIEFQKLPGAVVKRTGPLVAVVTGAQDQAAAEKLLANLQYEANAAWSAPIPLIIRPQTAGQIVLGAITLAGIIIAFCFLSGLIFGATKILRQKFGPSDAGGAMILLHLGEK
jgi:NAD/NADP transhydrogenase beta subunit